MPVPDPKRLRRTATCALVFNGQGQVLLHQRTDNGRWALPGGAIEIYETADVAVAREVLEETGYVVEVVRLVGIYSDPQFTTMTYPDGNTVSYVALAFECKAVGGAPALSDETSAVEWFDPDQLPEKFHRSHLPRLQDALARKEAAFYR